MCLGDEKVAARLVAFNYFGCCDADVTASLCDRLSNVGNYHYDDRPPSCMRIDS